MRIDRILQCIFLYNFSNDCPIVMKFGEHEANNTYFNTKYPSLHLKHVTLGSGHFYFENHQFWYYGHDVNINCSFKNVQESSLFYVKKKGIKYF